jgi:glucan phosphoethanolaminetransferase (alkaline phosphatase superfamily)
VSSINSVTCIQQEEVRIGEKSTFVFKKIKSYIQKFFSFADKNSSPFWIYIFLIFLPTISMSYLFIILGVGIFIIGFPQIFINLLGVLLILLGIFLPILILSKYLRKLVRSHFEFIGKEYTERNINYLSFLLSIIPLVLSILSVFFSFIF